MSTPVDHHRTPTTVPVTRAAVPSRPRRRVVFALAAAVLVTSGVGTTIALGPLAPERTPQAAQVMTLQLPDGSLAPACAEFELAFLQGMPVAFQGEVVDVGDTSAVLKVDRWFRGGQDDVTTVRVSKPGPEMSEGVEMTQGKTYLVSAQDGFVNSCGYTGELTPDLLASFEEAFGTR
ncbi:hypothetical protein [Promicromonospora soli]|nr:hypothetical protein [Promicromonospora soli]